MAIWDTEFIIYKYASESDGVGLYCHFFGV